MQAPVARERKDNEYLHDAQPYLGDRDWMKRIVFGPGRRPSNFLEGFHQRPRYVERYAWAVPNEKALQTIAKYGPILELGAGTGYWAYLLKRRGVSVRAYDLHPPNRSDNHYHPDQKTWTMVYCGGAEKLALYPKRALLLCWPPYASKMAYEALQTYQGSTVIYVGEWEGCTADNAFHASLMKHWTQVENVDLPTWPGIRDYLSVWKRKRDLCPPRVIGSRTAVTRVSAGTATGASRRTTSGRKRRK